MNTFKVHNLDPPVWEKLTNKIETIKKNTVLEIKESPELQKQREISKAFNLKSTKLSFFIFFILLSVTIFLIFNNLGFSVIGFLCGLATGCTFIFSVFALGLYYRSYPDFEETMIMKKLEDDFLDNEELALLKKFMSKDSLEKLLSANNLKVSLNNADYILNSDYYQDYYNTKMAEDIVNNL